MKLSIRTIVFLVCCPIIAIIAALILYQTVYSIDKQISRNVASLHKEIAVNPAVSSNPYDYVEGSEAFNRLVSLGEDALPNLENRLAANVDKGLEAYVLAIAIEKIANVDLKKNESTFWDTPEKFLEQWTRYTKSKP